MKTSASTPIRVDFLSAEALGLPGRIGMTIAPGKKDPGRDWDRDLGADLERLRRHERVDLLVCLLEDQELRLLGIPALLERARAAGLETERFPIEDVNAPPPSAMPGFAALVARLVAAAASGKTIAIHCRGGLGRSGLLAACVLVATGQEPRRAIALTRRARPGAIEVEAQARWVEAFAAARASEARAPAPQRPGSEDRAPRTGVGPSADAVVGCLLGGALGDALGYPVEFLSEPDIRARFGSAVPDRLADVTPARISDDTQMTLFVAEGCIRAAQRLADRGVADRQGVGLRALLRWYTTQGGQVGVDLMEPGWLVGLRALHARRAPGNTCLAALGALASGARIPDVSRPPNDSKGCGAVMRSAPIGLAASSRADAFRTARDAAVLTHGHPSGYLSAALLAAVVHDLGRGGSLEDALDAAGALLVLERGHEETSARVARARELAARGVPDARAIGALGAGWTGDEALAITVLCALTFEPAAPDAVKRALWTAAAHGGDSDSTAAIAGNLIGVRVGAAGLPGDWLDDLELRGPIERLGRDLHAAAVLGTPLDRADYPPS